MKPTFPLLLVPWVLAGCNVPLGGAPCPAGHIAGMIRINTAVVETTNAVIAAVEISNVIRNGQPLGPWEASGHPGSVGGDFTGIRVEGDRIICTPACSFGAPGQYTFDTGAQGAVTQKISVSVPARDAGGCGGITTGTPVTLNLRFEPAQ